MSVLYILVFVLIGEPDISAQPYLDDSIRSAMVEENCQEAADDLNSIEDGNRYWCIDVLYLKKEIR